jgi:hypothetical protein
MITRSWMAVAVLSACGVATAHASSFMNINFNGDTVGAQPGTNTAIGYPITQPYAIGGYDPNPDPNGGAYSSPPTAADGTIVVGNASGITKGAILTTDPNNNQIGALWMDTEYAVSANHLSLSFDLNVLAGTTATGQDGTLSTDSSTVHTLFGVNTFSSGTTLRFNALATSASGGAFGLRTSDGLGGYTITPFFNYTNGDTHRITLNADYNSGLVSVLVDGTTELTNFAFSTSSSSNTTVFETFFYLNGDLNTNASNSVALDNVTAAAVPLPTSAWMGLSLLAGMGGLALLRRRSAATC